MIRYLVVAIWPVGIAAILLVAYLAARRTPMAAPTRRDDSRRRSHRAGGGDPPLAEGLRGSARLVVVATAGTIAAVGIMCLLGLLVVFHGHVVDHPIFTWMTSHQVHPMTALMNRFTKIGDTWTTWGAAGAAAVCLTVAIRRRRWLPAVALTWMIFTDHYASLALRHLFHRLGPPTSPLGTYPSGGCDRTVLFYGLIAYLLWVEFGGRRRAAIWAIAVVTALGFNEGYSRVYLSKHWFTDAVSGLLYGSLLLVAFVVAVRAVEGRHGNQVAASAGRGGRAAVPAAIPVAGGAQE